MPILVNYLKKIIMNPIISKVENADIMLLFTHFFVKLVRTPTKTSGTLKHVLDPKKYRIELLDSERRNSISSIVSAAHEYDSITNRRIRG